MVDAGLEAVLIKVAGIGLTAKHLGKTLAEMQPTLLKLVGPTSSAGVLRSWYLRIRSMALTYAEKVVNTKRSPSIRLCTKVELNCKHLCAVRTSH